MKQETLAKAINIPQTTISRIENNKQAVSEEDIQKFAKMLGTTVEELKEPSKHNENIKGNQQTNRDAETFQQALSQFQEASQQMRAMIVELKADKEFLREENRQLRHRDEKWMQMLVEMQTQLAGFISKHKT